MSDNLGYIAKEDADIQHELHDSVWSTLQQVNLNDNFQNPGSKTSYSLAFAKQVSTGTIPPEMNFSFCLKETWFWDW